jgi:hypothetical protein
MRPIPQSLLALDARHIPLIREEIHDQLQQIKLLKRSVAAWRRILQALSSVQPPHGEPL